MSPRKKYCNFQEQEWLICMGPPNLENANPFPFFNILIT